MKTVRASIYTRTLFWWLGLALTIAVASMMSGCQDSKNLLYYDPYDTHKTPTIEGTAQVSEVMGVAGADILFVIDNSGSMGKYQQDVIDNADIFIRELTQSTTRVPWKIGLISTDEGNMPFLGAAPRPELNSNSPDPVGIFTSAVGRLGIGGSGTEQSFKPVVNFVDKSPKFFSSNSMLALIVITDAPEQSDMDVADFVAKLQKLKGTDPRKLRAYGSFATDDHCGVGAGETNWTWGGSIYEQLITQLNGSNAWLCSPNFGQDLAAIFRDIMKIVTTPRFFLKQIPRLETLKVLYRGIEVPPVGKPNGVWLYDAENNSIVITDMSYFTDLNSSVGITYSVNDGLPYRP